MVKGRIGMYVEIIGNCNNHGFGIGEIVKIKRAASCGIILNRGASWVCRGTNGTEWFVRECDMIPAKAVIL